MKNKHEESEARRLYRRLWMRKWHRENKDVINARRCQRRKDNSEIAERHRIRSLKYYHKNKKACQERNKIYRTNPANRRKAVKAAKEWQVRNPERNRLCQRISERRRRDAIGKYTLVDIQEMMKKQKGKCIYCTKKIRKKFHVDHKIPIKKGGTHWPYNLQLTCPPCNHRKSAKTHEEFLVEIRKRK